jgi:thymidylate synthase (FAD)
MYVRYRWTASLHAVMNFLQQRLEHDAQKEIQDLALVVREITKESFPESLKLL